LRSSPEIFLADVLFCVRPWKLFIH
jgi:hypothetical protein